MNIGTVDKVRFLDIIQRYFKMWTSAVLLLEPVTTILTVRIQRDLMTVPA